MASSHSTGTLPLSSNLFPSPLRIRKKPRRASRKATIFHKRITVLGNKSGYGSPKTPQHHDRSGCGPLDDIISEIISDIWSSPSCGVTEGPLKDPIDWKPPLRAPSTCTISTVTPLPVSRVPSNQPLRIRKHRSSRSTASWSSATQSLMALSRSSSSRDITNTDNRSRSPTELQPRTLPPSDCSDETHDTGPKRRLSRIRLLPVGITRLLRSGSGATRLALEVQAETTMPRDLFSEQHDMDSSLCDSSLTCLTSVTERAGGSIPSPLQNCYMTERARTRESTRLPIFPKATVDILSEINLLQSDETQEFYISVEIEGSPHHSQELPNSSINVVFVIDNQYYVSNDCLSRAVHAASGALRQLSANDRVALYTTDRNDSYGKSNASKELISLQPADQDTKDLFNSLTFNIAKHGTQNWNSPCLTQNISDTISDIALSLQTETSRYGCCHIFFLSPRFNVVHELFGTFPSLRVHQINPAVIPFTPSKDSGQIQCLQACCKNVSSCNWTNYQPMTSCIRECISRARCKPPTGSMTDIHVGLRPNSGCEIVRIEGNTSMESLQIGQIFSFLARVRVSPPHTLQIDPNLDDPLFQDSLDSTTLRQEIHVAEKFGATLADVLTVQVFYKNNLNSAGTWSYTEAPLALVKHLGRLPHPHDHAQEVYKRKTFYIANNFDNATAEKELRKLSTEASSKEPKLQQVVEDVLRELEWQHAVLKYEATARQKLPHYTGSIEIVPAKNYEHV